MLTVLQFFMDIFRIHQEPMVNMGKVNVVTDEKNGWEVSTADGLPSAQWEIQVLVTEDGHEVISW